MGTIKLSDVELWDIQPLDGKQPLAARAEWPCPFCGHQRPVASSYHARARNRIGDPHERAVRLCADCVGGLLVS